MKGIQRTIRRRRLEAKTDYLARRRMLQSRKPRVVIRRTNKYIIVQVVTSDVAKDKVVLTVSSKDLLTNGWPANLEGSLKGLAAGYLTGRLMGAKMPKDMKDAIIDLGMQQYNAGGRLAAVIRGLAEGGVNISYSKDKVPNDARLESNKKTREAFLKVKENLKK